MAARRWLFSLLAGLFAVVWAPTAQQPTSGAAGQQPSVVSLSSAAGVEPSSETAPFVYSNRTITVLRARALGREPSERIAIGKRLLDDLVSQHVTGPVEIVPVEGGRILTVSGRIVIGITSVDIDDPTPQALDAEANRAANVLRQALTEALEARTPWMMFRAVGLSLLGLAVAVAMLFLIALARRRLAHSLLSATERQVSKAGQGSLEVLRASRILDFWRGLVSLVSMVLGLVVTYFAVTFILRQFPYTRPWGESMRSFMVDRAAALGLSMVHAIPALFTVLLIALVARFVSRLLHLLFNAIEQRRLDVAWIHPETAQPTRRLVNTLLWVFALVMAYPYLPGSDTDAFKGASVFLGLVLSLGSSGFVNQIMSSFMITYSRALHIGDYVKIGDIEGTVIHLGVLSTKVRTPRGEEITIPNANVVSQTMTNYSPSEGVESVYVPTSVTIGYDTPWRQVESLLLMAAERTPTVRQSPPPFVSKAGLEDWYVRYVLLVCPENPHARLATMSALHANILDAFNQYGVQIMSPNYEADPEHPKVVPPERWHAAPASAKQRTAAIGE
jgi:small-conductance mechanosensitive channel